MISMPQIDAEYDIVIAGGKSSPFTYQPLYDALSRRHRGLPSCRSPRHRLSYSHYPRPRSGPADTGTPRAYTTSTGPLAHFTDVDDHAIPQGGEDGGPGWTRARRVVRAVFGRRIERKLHVGPYVSSQHCRG